MASNNLTTPIIMPIRNPFCGKPKRNINTNTPIELQCEMEKVEIFYTIDGSKPNPRNLPVVSTYGTTHKYLRPFRLGPGKQTIKALASNEHHESSIVTKVFHVEWIEPPPLEGVKNAVEGSLRRKSDGFIAKVSHDGHTDARLPRPKSAMASSDQAEFVDESERCPYCFTAKAIDSFVGFCYRCGAKLFLSSNALSGHSRPSFGRAEAAPAVPIGATSTQTSLAATNTLGDVWIDGREWDMTIKDNTCVSCGRNNCRDSRYCDCCGSRLNRQCTICTSEQNPVHAKFCLQCGSALVDGIDIEARDEQYEPLPSRPVPIVKNQSTQTVGLFYPSSKELSVKAKEGKICDRRPTSCSPGSGYWRQQIDYISAHLKTYAYNNMEFRNLVREPRIGSLLYVRLKEIESDCLNILMSFTLEQSGSKKSRSD